MMNPTILTILLLFVVVDSKDITVSLDDCGEVKGTATETPYGPIFEFYQIPYAVQPVKRLRWTHSVPLTSATSSCWPGTYDASALRNPPIMCVQKYKAKNWADGNKAKKGGQEDCLHLTVRSPNLQPTEPLPVLVWIHGGSLNVGWSEEEGYAPNAEFTGDLDVVTVNINYRLDLMGFFSSPEIWNDEENPGNFGNFGIGDALTALKWVKENIGKFGGDPSSVTILGESSGGTIVMGLIGSPEADGLFNKAISLSGPPVWEATYEDQYERRKNFTVDVGCTQRTEAQRRKCLKKMDLETLIKHQDLERGWGFYDFPYGYGGRSGESMDYNVIEPTLIPFSPTDPSKWSRKQHVKLLVSNTAQEVGTYAMFYSTNQVYNWEDAEATLKGKLEVLESETGRTLPEDLYSEILDTYNFGQDSDDWWPQIFFDTLTTDVRTTCINNDLVDNLNENSKLEVYRMYIKSRPAEMKCGLPWTCIHGWDTEALFGYGYYNLTSSSDRHQRKFRDNLRDVVEDFCYDGNILQSGAESVVIMENYAAPNTVTIGGTPPQSEQCEMWQDFDMLQYGWQN